jgi:hypothetical protein
LEAIYRAAAKAAGCIISGARAMTGQHGPPWTQAFLGKSSKVMLATGLCPPAAPTFRQIACHQAGQFGFQDICRAMAGFSRQRPKNRKTSK